MTGTVELDPDGMHLLIRFPYREDLVALVKQLPGRRWDPKQKLWRVPATQAEAVFTALSRHLFEFAPEIPSLLAGTLQPKSAPTVERPHSRPTTAVGRAPPARPHPPPPRPLQGPTGPCHCRPTLAHPPPATTSRHSPCRP
jgi:hypothetical protein